MIETTLEQKLLIASIVWVAVAPRFASTLHARLMSFCAQLGRSRGKWILACALLGGLVPGLVARFVLWPEPSVHDEFAHLLMAETFAHGEVAMPTHPLWEHFETFHIIHQPAYAAKYPPAMALAPALGIALFDEPAFGLWLQSALMCAAIAWMLLGWLPPRWAVLGSIVGLLQFGSGGPWVHSYYGGAVAATGGALVFGALGRILRGPRIFDSLVLGSGLVLLANSRPYEGLVLSLPVAGALIAYMVRNRHGGDLRLLSRLVAPTAAVLVVAGVAMGAYHERITGSPTKLPYAEYDAQYAVYPSFLWQPKHPEPEYRHEVLREFALGFQAGDHELRGDVWAMIGLALERSVLLGQTFVGWPLLVPLLALAFGRRARGAGLALTACGLVLLALFLTTYLESRYAAPAAAALLLLVAAGWRALPRIPRIGERRAHAISVALAAALCVLSADRALPRAPTGNAWFGYKRATLRDRLLAQPGDHLVIVHYEPGHSVHHEWVFNEADIDHARIVWARDMGTEANLRLLEYYAERKPWRLVAGTLPGNVLLEPIARED